MATPLKVFLMVAGFLWLMIGSAMLCQYVQQVAGDTAAILTCAGCLTAMAGLFTLLIHLLTKDI
jgi:hypothetical protein